MTERAPVFPPLLAGHRIGPENDPVLTAIQGADDGTFGAGDFLWVEDPDILRFALVLEPEVPRKRCGEILMVMMNAFGDAVGAISPPEVSVTWSWPSDVRLNDAHLGRFDLQMPRSADEEVPEWMVVSAETAINPPETAPEPGTTPDRTSLWDEGCVGISHFPLLEAVARHLVAAIHGWDEDGFQSAHAAWWGRRSEKSPLTGGLTGELIGLDEHGNALVKHAGKTRVEDLTETLDGLRRDAP